MDIYAICKICREKITGLNESEKSIVEKHGADSGVIGHFDCAYRDIHGHDYISVKEHKKVKCKYKTN